MDPCFHFLTLDVSTKAGQLHMFRQTRLVPAVEYIQANRLRSWLMEDMARLMSGIDAYLAASFGPNVRRTSISLTGRLFDRFRSGPGPRLLAGH